MTSYESLHIFKLIKISILFNFLTVWNFFLQFSTFFNMKKYQSFPVISMHVEKQCSSPLRNFDSKHPNRTLVQTLTIARVRSGWVGWLVDQEVTALSDSISVYTGLSP